MPRLEHQRDECRRLVVEGDDVHLRAGDHDVANAQLGNFEHAFNHVLGVLIDKIALLGIGLAAFAALIAAAAFGAFSLEPVAIAEKVGVAIVLIALFFFGYVFLFGQLSPDEAKRIAVIVVLFFGAATFFMGFELAGSTFNLFARDFTDRSAFGSFFADGQHPASWYQSLNPLFVVAFSPVFAALWVQLGKRNLEPSIPAKFALGLIQMGLGFIVIAWAAHLVVSGGDGTKVLPVWLLLTYLLHTFGELCLSPIGLSAVTKLAPPRYVSQMMGTWFAGTALGNLLSGLIAESDGLPPVTRRGFADLLSRLVSAETVRTGGATHPRLRILGAIEARVVRADLLVVAGLEEGVWPQGAPLDPFLSRPMRKALGLPPAERRIGLSAHDFVQAASSAEVVLNWNLYNGGSDQARVRQYANLLNQAGDSRDKACRDARQTAAIAFNEASGVSSLDLTGNAHTATPAMAIGMM